MQRVLTFLRGEPALVRAAVAFLLVVAARYGLDLDEEVVWTALAALGVSGIATRQAVTPAPPKVSDPDPHVPFDE